MKKIAFSLAGVLAATAFAPEASAIPAFARQTSMPCQACHFQHFPVLNSFGRAFKASGYTMMGSQAKVEGEHLSIPDTLNISALATVGINSISNSAPNNNNTVMVPNGGGELSLFFGGRISENIGFLSEFAFPDNAPNSSAAKMPMLWDLGGVRAGLVAVANQRPSYSFELLNTGADNAHRLMGNVGTTNSVSGGKGNHVNVTSAHQYLGTSAGGHGLSVVVTGEMGFVNIGKYGIGGAGGTAAFTNQVNQTYLRGAYIFNAGGWDSAVGIQNFSGKDGTPGGVGADTKATIIDGQMLGEAGGMPVTLIASYGRAPTTSNTMGNIYNPNNATTKSSFNIAGELGVIPHKATVQLAFRSGNNGAASGANKDNGIMIGGTYELAQNVELSLTHTANSGNAYNPGPVTGKSQTTLLLEALF